MNPVFKGLGKELRSYGLTVKKVDGWQTRGTGGTFEPRSIVDHHTASSRNSGNTPSVGIVTHGRTGLPGPLSNFVLGRDGTIVFIAAGRCNHAGYGGPFRGIPRDSANPYTIGIEAENDGIGEPWTDEQLRAYYILNAVLLRRMKRTAYNTFGHKEWTSRKIDPHPLDMSAFRAHVRAALKKRWHLKATKGDENRKVTKKRWTGARRWIRSKAKNGWRVNVRRK